MLVVAVVSRRVAATGPLETRILEAFPFILLVVAKFLFLRAVIEANSISLLHGSPQVMEHLSPVEAAELHRR